MPINHTSQYAELTNEQFALIGRIAVEWSNIEHLLGVLLSHLLYTPEFLGRVYTDEMNASGVQEALKKAVEIHECRYACKAVSSAVLGEITKLNDEIGKFRGTRNRFAHFCWWRSNDQAIFGTGFSGSVPSSKRHAKDYITISVADLKEIYGNARGFVDRLMQLIEQLPQPDESRCVESGGGE